jgi:hypothetical protein
MIAQKPLFYVVLRDGDQWLIEVEWPDGSIEYVQAFKAHSEAVNWVKTHSETWLQERVWFGREKRAAEQVVWKRAQEAGAQNVFLGCRLSAKMARNVSSLTDRIEIVLLYKK